MNVLLVFAIIYIPLMIVLVEVIHAQGRKLLQHAFGSGSPVASAVSVLLRIGWYMTAAGLLFWNLGSDVGDSAKKSLFAAFQEVCLRLGIALFTVGVLQDSTFSQCHYSKKRTRPNTRSGRLCTSLVHVASCFAFLSRAT
jgi:amino acid transporter